MHSKIRQMIKIGCCGLGFSASQHFGENWKQKYSSRLQAYATKFPVIEINTSFYRIPSLKVAKAWREEVDAVNKDFEFTLKVFQGITHADRFATRKSIQWFNEMKKVARVLRSKILLFQSPASFKPTEQNLKKVEKFFRAIDRDKLKLAWEVRWQDSWPQSVVKTLFSKLKLNQCVDPFRFDFCYAKDFVYYRLHGMGTFSMYSYKFTDKDFKILKPKLKSRKPVYVLFNNVWMFEDALRLARSLSK